MLHLHFFLQHSASLLFDSFSLPICRLISWFPTIIQWKQWLIFVSWIYFLLYSLYQKTLSLHRPKNLRGWFLHFSNNYFSCLLLSMLDQANLLVPLMNRLCVLYMEAAWKILQMMDSSLLSVSSYYPVFLYLDIFYQEFRPTYVKNRTSL